MYPRGVILLLSSATRLTVGHFEGWQLRRLVLDKQKKDYFDNQIVQNSLLIFTLINVRFIWKIIHISKYEKTHYQYIEMRFFVSWDTDTFLDETGINHQNIPLSLTWFCQPKNHPNARDSEKSLL